MMQLVMGVFHQAKSSLNPGFETVSMKQVTLSVFVLLYSMDWNSTNVFQFENIG